MSKITSSETFHVALFLSGMLALLGFFHAV